MSEHQQWALYQLEENLKLLVSSRSGRRLFLQSLPLLLVACSTPEKTRYREGDNQGQKAALSVEEEKRMTQELLPELRKDYPKLKDPQMQSYISDLGQKIVRANRLEGNPYRYNFSVVDVNYVNAFALPGGTVFVTTPLIAMADSEAELAGVVGHEIGHIKARHSAERMYQAQKAQRRSWLYALGGGLAGAALGYGVGTLVCPPKDRNCLQNAAKYGGAAGVGGGLLIQKYGFLANSREDEMEADRIGFNTSFRAGYDKDHVGGFYEKLQRMEEERQQGTGILAPFADAMSTHPPSRERVRQMRQMASQAQGRGKVNSPAFAGIRQRATQVSRKKGAQI